MAPSKDQPEDHPKNQPNDTEGVVLTPEQQRSRRTRNIAIGVTVALFVVLFYIVTIAKMGAHVLDRAM